MRKQGIYDRDLRLVGYEIFADNPGLITDEYSDLAYLYKHTQLVQDLPKGLIYFLNINPKTLIKFPVYIKNILSNSKREIWLEVTEREADEKAILEMVQKEKIDIVIDDLGTEGSCINRLETLQKHIKAVKIDRNLWAMFEKLHYYRRNGEKVIIEKIETEEEFYRMRDSGDWFQGFIFDEVRILRGERNGKAGMGGNVCNTDSVSGKKHRQTQRK